MKPLNYDIMFDSRKYVIGPSKGNISVIQI